MSIILTAAAFSALLAQGIPVQATITLPAGYRQIKLSPVNLEKVQRQLAEDFA